MPSDTSRAVFGQGTYALSDALRLSLGLRYTKEKKTQDGFLLLDGVTCTPAALAGGASVVTPNVDQPVGGCSIPNAGTLNFSSTNFKTGVEYDVGARSMLYANVGTGFKAGGFWPGTAPNTYKPEKLTAYTFGSKNRFLNNTLQANFELFYWDYKDQQISVFTGINPAGQTARPFNVDGFVRGLQTNLTYKLTRDDQLGLDLLNSQGRYKQFPLGTNVLSQSVNNYATDMPAPTACGNFHSGCARPTSGSGPGRAWRRCRCRISVASGRANLRAFSASGASGPVTLHRPDRRGRCWRPAKSG